MVKQLNYVWLTSEITMLQLQNTSSTLTVSEVRVHGTRLSFYHVVLVKIFVMLLTRSHLQLINTLINTFLANFVPFWWNKEGQ